MVVRYAAPGEFPEVMSILEAALLEVRGDSVRAAIQSESVLVYAECNRILGVVVSQTDPVRVGEFDAEDNASIHIEAIAVRPNRRNQGIGRELIEELLACYGSATVTFEENAKPFYQSLDVSILTTDDDAYFGVLESDSC